MNVHLLVFALGYGGAVAGITVAGLIVLGLIWLILQGSPTASVRRRQIARPVARA